jgi:ABC-2 type transport system permease protein
VPDALALSWRQYRLERRMFWRNPSAAFFNFVLPLLFLAALGVAFAHVIPNFESTAAYVNAVFLPVVFVSFFVFDDKNGAPGFVHTIAEALPLKPLIDGLSGAMVTGSGLSSHLDSLAVIALWGVFGLYLAVRGFSWESSRA